MNICNFTVMWVFFKSFGIVQIYIFHANPGGLLLCGSLLLWIRNTDFYVSYVF